MVGLSLMAARHGPWVESSEQEGSTENTDPFVSEINAEILLPKLHLSGMEISAVTAVPV